MEIRRGTFEYVQKSQDVFFFDFLKKFIKAEDTIDPESRMDYFKTIADAFLGVEKSYDYIVRHNGNVHNLGTLSYYARKLAFIEDNELDSEKQIVINDSGNKIKIPIKVLWEALRESCFDPAAEALNLGLRTSAEMVTREGGVFEFAVDKKLGEK